MRLTFLRAATALAGCALLAGPAPAQFVQDLTDVPNESSTSGNVDFGDVDLDGDWDAVFADGGDDGNDQNRIWINQGGLQARAVGAFVDETTKLFPALQDNSHDIEFVDFDADGDLDIYVSNTSPFGDPQGNRWWTNTGGAQGGTVGAYVDETGARWVGLDSADSSVPTSLLIPDAENPETFIDWSSDSDFGDLDNDGDMDLFHSSFGVGPPGGGVPSRIFLNDGDGFFEEFNPSGFKLPNSEIQNGDPGIWAEGVQQHGTEDSTGAQCDVAGSALDIDLGDVDGDLDLDVMHGSLYGETRFFTNRLEENGGAPGDLGFRDTTTATYPPNWTSGHRSYEQEFGDIDNDQDLDIHGVNWNGFTDVYMLNDGDGVFGDKTNLPSSGADDNEGDFLDYDNDGDLDLFVANFSGANKLHRNQLVETGSVDYVLQQTGLGSGTSLDADCVDYDADGDTDVIVAQHDFPNLAMLNVTQTPDAIPPTLSRLEGVAGHPAQKEDDVVRVQVYDNAPYYVTWYNETVLEVRVKGIPIPDLPMVSSGGQIFRGELPGHFVGTVEYRARSSDEYGNTGFSAAQSYANTGDDGFSVGASTPSNAGTPTLISLTRGIAGEEAYLVTGGVTPGTLGLVLVSASQVAPTDLGDGIVLNVGASPIPPIVLPSADANGQNVIAIAATPLVLSGATVYSQYFALDGAGGANWASSQALGLAFE